MIFSDCSVVWGVLRVTESARKNVGGAPIANRKYSTCWSEILLCGGNPEDKHAFDLQIIPWNETISNQKTSWQKTSITNMSWSSTKGFGHYHLGMRRSDIQNRYRLRSGQFLRIGYRSDETDPNPMLCVYCCVVVKPHESHKNIIKHHKVFVHYISSVLKLFHSLIWGTEEYLNL